MSNNENGSEHRNGNGNGFTTSHQSDPISFKLTESSQSSLDKVIPPSPTMQSPAMRRNASDGNLMAQDVKEARVRVIYTGGTIGMMRNERNGKWIERT